MNSKTKLGVIILALRLLRKLGILAPRLVSSAAEHLQLSRKTGYKSARDIQEILTNCQQAQAANDLRDKELAKLRIQVQVLRFERDHPQVRFAARRKHLPVEARSLAVRILRDFAGQLSETEIAVTIGVALSSLKRWDKEADPDCGFPKKPDRRGEHRRASAEDVERVLNEYRRLKESMTLEAFTARFNQRHPDHKLDRKTITRILQAHGERDITTRNDDRRYHPPFEVYFPGAQVAVDATETKVLFASQPHEPVKLKKEVAIDIASGTILGNALGREETAEGVERVIVEARKECETLLAILSDNGSANRSQRTDEVCGKETELGQIFTFPYHPQTDGHIEGFFGQFSRIVGKIDIDDSTKETLASSIVAIIWRIFIYFHNYSPRKRLGGRSPLEYLRQYVPTRAETDAARAGLKKRRERSEELRRENSRLSSPGFRELVERVLQRHRLEIDIDQALKALLPYDECVIGNASNALFVASQRDGFDERKRTFAYFMGIVRNKQKEIDAERLRKVLDLEKTKRILAQRRAEQREREQEKTQENEDLQRRPERVVLKYARMLLIGRLRYMQRTWGDGLRRALQALRDLGRGSRVTLESLAAEIRSWDFREQLKEQMVEVLFGEYEATVNSS